MTKQERIRQLEKKLKAMDELDAKTQSRQIEAREKRIQKMHNLQRKIRDLRNNITKAQVPIRKWLESKYDHDCCVYVIKKIEGSRLECLQVHISKGRVHADIFYKSVSDIVVSFKLDQNRESPIPEAIEAIKAMHNL